MRTQSRGDGRAATRAGEDQTPPPDGQEVERRRRPHLIGVGQVGVDGASEDAGEDQREEER